MAIHIFQSMPSAVRLPICLAISAASFVLAVICALGGCDRDRASGKADAPLAEVRLGYFANLTHAQAVLGVSCGDYANAIAPVKLTPKVFNAGPSLIEALFA